MKPQPLIQAAALAALTSGCATTLERGLSADLADRQPRLAPAREGDEPSATRDPPQGGKLESYVAYALEHSPALRARFDEWQASTHRIAQQRRLPEPVFTYGLYLSRVETRVGPQRHRFSLSQALPWPTALTDGVDAAALEAQSSQRRFDAAALGIARRVAAAYWRLWLIDRTRRVQREQLEILAYVSDSARTRLEINQATLAEVGQIQLSTSRLTDTLSGLDEQKRAVSAELVAAMGAPPRAKVSALADAPSLRLPAEDGAALRSSLAIHPDVEALALMAQSRRDLASSVEAEGYPSFIIGVDYIETGEALAADVPDSGKDAVILNLGVRIPLWWNVYGARRDQAEAESSAFSSKRAAAIDEANGELEKTLSAVRDTVRRVKLYRGTLVPQAETVYGSVLGSYQTGASSLAEVLLAQRDLLELQLGLYRAQAQHAVAWARLEEIVGRDVRARKVS